MNRQEASVMIGGLISRGEAFRRQFEEAYRWRWYRYSDLNPGFSLWKDEVLRVCGGVLGSSDAFYSRALSAIGKFSGRAPGTVFSMLLTLLAKAREELARTPAAVPAAGVKYDYTEEMLARAEEMSVRSNYTGAVILGGAVLDDMLRRLCSAHGLFCAENASLSVLNNRLLQRGVYGPEEHAELALRIRLKEAAGLPGGGGNSEADAEAMLAWLKDFRARHMADAPAVRPGITA